MLIPRLFSANPEVYANLFNAEMLVFDLIGLFIAAAIARQLGKSPWKTLAVYTVALIALARFWWCVMILYPLYCSWQPSISSCEGILPGRGNAGVGALTKIFPLGSCPCWWCVISAGANTDGSARGAGAFALPQSSFHCRLSS